MKSSISSVIDLNGSVSFWMDTYHQMSHIEHILSNIMISVKNTHKNFKRRRCGRAHNVYACQWNETSSNPQYVCRPLLWRDFIWAWILSTLAYCRTEQLIKTVMAVQCEARVPYKGHQWSSPIWAASSAPALYEAVRWHTLKRIRTCTIASDIS